MEYEWPYFGTHNVRGCEGITQSGGEIARNVSEYIVLQNILLGHQTETLVTTFGSHAFAITT